MISVISPKVCNSFTRDNVNTNNGSAQGHTPSVTLDMNVFHLRHPYSSPSVSSGSKIMVIKKMYQMLYDSSDLIGTRQHSMR